MKEYNDLVVRNRFMGAHASLCEFTYMTLVLGRGKKESGLQFGVYKFAGIKNLFVLHLVTVYRIKFGVLST